MKPQVAFGHNFKKTWVWQCDACNSKVLNDNEEGPPGWEVGDIRTICPECRE